MKFIARTFTVVGFLVALFATSGAIGIGHFRLYYGDAPVVCEPSHVARNQFLQTQWNGRWPALI